ncbi:hypothetical protein ACFWAP_00530 [Streptomyces goshikiensis]|uniref:hypothetical protein n=1 Tax=Streptomyces goshikiensis TaxID=1942 RepID=UPI00364F307A
MNHDDDYPQGRLHGWPDAPVSIPRDIASSTTLSRAAVGLYAYLLTRDADAPLTTAALADELDAPLPQVNSWYIELKSAGMITAGGR